VVDPEQGQTPATGTRPLAREPYHTPAVAWEEPLDVRPGLMAACLKLAGQGEPCDTTSSS
jgi:hypothetical protein